MLPDESSQQLFALQKLLELNQRIGYLLDFQELFHRLQNSLHELVDFDLSASLVAEDPASGRFESVLTFYLPGPVSSEIKHSTKEKLLSTYEKLTRRSLSEVRLLELHSKQYRPETTPINELNSFFNVPLIVDGDTTGLLYVAACQAGAFNESQLSLLYRVAGQASEAVQRLQSLLRREQAHLEAVVSGLGEGILLLDKNLRLRLINPFAIHLIRQLGEALPVAGKPLRWLASLELHRLWSLVEDRSEGQSLVSTLGVEPGPFVQIWVSRAMVLQEPVLLLVLRDITQDRQHEQALRQLSLTDPLTSLANRRAFFESLQTEITRARRHQLDLALIMLDLDHLKTINDTCGHLAGDEALRQVAVRMRQECRQSDLAARYGGDEFVLLLPHTNLEGAYNLAKRLLDDISRVQIEQKFYLSVSLGVAILSNEDDKQGDQLVARADQALYAAKNAGRGRVVVWEVAQDR